jgi:hypothetical protein
MQRAADPECSAAALTSGSRLLPSADGRYNFGRMLARHWALPAGAEQVTTVEGLRQYNYYAGGGSSPAALHCLPGC